MADTHSIPPTPKNVQPTQSRTERPHRIAINGAGRIGRLLIRQILDEPNPNLHIIAVVGPAVPESFGAAERMEVLSSYASNVARLLIDDSAHGRWLHHVDVVENHDRVYLVIDATHRIELVPREQSPSQLPWSRLEIDILAETSGAHARADLAREHLQAGARYVVVGAPGKQGKDGSGYDGTYVYGVNHLALSSDQHLVSNASCTTNCTAPLVHVLQQFGMEAGVVVTTHSATGSQPVLDRTNPKSPERGMAAFANIIDTATGVAKALQEVDPSVACEFTASAFRVPTLNGSLVSGIFRLATQATTRQITDALALAAQGDLAGVLQLRQVELSGKIVGDTAISTVVPDSMATIPTGDGGTLVMLQAWYDNEAGYAQQFIRMLEEVAVTSEQSRSASQEQPPPRSCSIKLNPSLSLAELSAAQTPAASPVEVQPKRPIRLAINATDRIGLIILRQLVGDSAFDPVLITSSNPDDLVERLKWDVVYGSLDARVTLSGDSLAINGKPISVVRHPFDAGDPGAAIWDRYGVDVVIDVARTLARREQFERHWPAGAPKAIVALSETGAGVPSPLVAPGLNKRADLAGQNVLWYPDVVTHALAPVLKVFLDHGQVDAVSFVALRPSDGGRCMEAGQTGGDLPPYVPRNTGLSSSHADSLLGQILPALRHKIRGDDIWVDVPGGSAISLVVQLAGHITPDDVNALLLRASLNQCHGIIAVDEKIDSSTQVIGRSEAGIVATRATRVIGLPGGRSLVKTHIWYAEVWGYARQLLRLAHVTGAELP